MAEDYTIKIIAYDKEDLDRIQELRNPGIVAWRMERSRPQSSELERSSAWHYANGTMTKLSEPRICLGTDRVMALVPSAAQAGDVIIQFWNCSAAVVMRPVLSGSGGPASSFLLVGRADVAEHPDSDVFSGIDQRAENKLLCVPESGASTFQSSGAVYVDLDFRTLSIITASIDSRRKI
ncbi:hypothetical protein EJ08DRAFT_714302 [Tothia fuscella]|uniref:Uncharacterized protein n=1 Tax=Tothia fuscella TaxID=1048955 RepID=A0A9P4NS24_9PEZI|nr:hypothetical protein EJ08DRAFT_714302 [Tothia fuscella]